MCQFLCRLLQVRFVHTCQHRIDVLLRHVEHVTVDLCCHGRGEVVAAGLDFVHAVSLQGQGSFAAANGQLLRRTPPSNGSLQRCPHATRSWERLPHQQTNRRQGHERGLDRLPTRNHAHRTGRRRRVERRRSFALFEL